MNGFRLAAMHWKVGAMNEVQYRVNFFLQLIDSAIRLATGLIAIWLVFSHTEDLAGWSRHELLAVMGIHILLSGINRTFVEPNVFQFIYTIGEGEFDYVLARPVDSQLMVSVRNLRFWQLVDVIVGGVVIVWAVIGIVEDTSWVEVLAFLVAVFCGAIILYCMWMVVAAAAFKWIRVDDTVQLLNGLFQAGRWPVTIYPGWLRLTLTFVVPLAFAITVPAESLASRLTGGMLALTLIVTAIMLLITRVAWQHGVRNYSGASA